MAATNVVQQTSHGSAGGEDSQCAVTVRHSSHQHLDGLRIAPGRDVCVGLRNWCGINHPNAVRAMRAVKNDGATQSALRRLRRDVRGKRRWHAPTARALRGRTQHRLNTIDRTHPLGEADIVATVRSGSFPWSPWRFRKRFNCN